MTTLARRITGGVDTHLDVHVAAALDERGALLGVESFETSTRGYAKLLAWMRAFGTVELVGIEGTGSYGAGLTRHLHEAGVAVVEVDRPNRQRRRRKGKSDPEDAVGAARAAQSGDAHGEAKTRDGNVEVMRVLRIARISARKSRTQALNQMRSLVSTAPEPIRAELRGLSVHHLLDKTAAYRPGTKRDIVSVTKLALRMLAHRALDLEAQIKKLDAIVKPLVKATAPELVARDASSGKSERHRLNRSGDRQANSALWHIVLTRMVYDPNTRHYIERRMKEGKTKKEALRSLKRQISNAVYRQLLLDAERGPGGH